MITIVEPKEHIDKLWGKQKIREGETYRMMRYVLRVDHEDKVLLHNVVTGRLVVLDGEEAEALATLPAAYYPAMEQLVTEHYLVPEDSDEYQQVVNLRSVLRKLNDSQKLKDITKYTILPTTACNARCYYCFEKGVTPLTMTEQTANDVVKFIACHCGEKKKIHLSWFGGEPTLASNRIDQICKGLQEKDIQYSSDMTTNGYLFDEEMVSRAKTIWNLQYLMISVDGTEENYNKTKSYVNVADNPYQRVMKNIGLLLEQGIRLNLRMNFDLENYDDFYELAEEIARRFPNTSLLKLQVHPVNGEHKNHNGVVQHGNNAWFTEKIVELNDIARRASLLKDDDFLPCLRFGCQAASDSSIVISANGLLSKCPEQFGNIDAIGDLKHGVTNMQLVQSWKEFADYPVCIICAMFPACAKINNCSVKECCNFLKETEQRTNRVMYQKFDNWRHEKKQKRWEETWYSKNPK